jgi:hypothetical protein
MVRVYFESSMHAELVAVFMDEYTYKDCVPALERLCKDMGFDRLTESIEYSEEAEMLIKVIEKL